MPHLEELLEAYNPLVRGERFDHPVVADVAKNAGHEGLATGWDPRTQT